MPPKRNIPIYDLCHLDAFHLTYWYNRIIQWHITHDPLYLAVGGVEMYIDLGAEPLIAAEKDDEKIAIEVKSFLQPSTISEFHTAVGQFLNYRRALRQEVIVSWEK